MLRPGTYDQMMRPGLGVRHPDLAVLLEPDSLEQLGRLHLKHLTVQPADHPYPHPDFLQVVYAGRASERSSDQDGGWTDTAGYEISSCLMSRRDAHAAVDRDPLSRPFLDLRR